MPRIELTAGDVTVIVDAPRVALATVHRLALEGLAAVMIEATRHPRPYPIGFAAGAGGQAELAELVDTPYSIDARTGAHNPPTRGNP